MPDLRRRSYPGTASIAGAREALVLEAAGGLKALTRETRLGSIDRLAASFKAIRAAIDGQFGQLKLPKPRPRPAPAPARPPNQAAAPPASRADARPIRRG